jgi:hypothetical protein
MNEVKTLDLLSEGPLDGKILPHFDGLAEKQLQTTIPTFGGGIGK